MPWKSFWFGIKYALMFQIMYWLMVAQQLWEEKNWNNAYPYYYIGAGVSFFLTTCIITYLHVQREKQLVSDRSGQV